MRLTKVTFNGYKRLADTSCNLDGRLVAVAGPNEAGKSSLLEGLAWLSDGQSAALPIHLRSRALGDLPATHMIVTARFALDDGDHIALADLDTDVRPSYFRYIKAADGTYFSSAEPSFTRRREALDSAETALKEAVVRHPEALSGTSEASRVPGWLSQALAALRHGDAAPDGDAESAFESLAAWLRRSPDAAPGLLEEDGGEVPDPLDAAAADVLDAALAKLKEAPVDVEGRRRLAQRMPKFLLFTDADRELLSSYDLDSEPLAGAVPPALRNLLGLADTSLAELRKVRDSGDTTRLHNLLKKTNARLRIGLQPTWRQKQLAVHINVSGNQLQILVDELDDDGERTDIAERSDGLRTFIALVCFLAARDIGIPPVLMVDEAETHLHYDAQADLVDVLLKHVKASSVIYTTHSPGCLPPDLGTGIRLVSPDPANGSASKFKGDFWGSHVPGFSPLLFAMGAGAAAFSVCRGAVLGEGATEMILLPSLLRKATGNAELGYQVAPGLATYTPDLTGMSVAARVVYLTDGDTGGGEHRKRLRTAGIDASKIHSLPAGLAIEDLLTSDAYLAAAHALMADAGYRGARVETEQLGGTGPIASRLKNWCITNGHPVPGKTAVASYLVQDPARIMLTPPAALVPQDLDRRFREALE